MKNSSEGVEINPWEVKGKVEYEKLIKEFGTKPITYKEIDLLTSTLKSEEDLTFLIRRGIFFSHRDLDLVMKEYVNGRKFFLYTGRGPSGKMHIGHLLPFILAKWFQDNYDVNIYIEITDDEKFVYNRNKSIEEIDRFAEDNIKDIAAMGFDEDKTFIFRDMEYIKHVYPLALRIARKINFSTAKAVFGFNSQTNIGLMFYPAMQIVPTFFEEGRALIPSAIDQDPYWRIQRDIAESLNGKKAAAIHSKFLPPLTGMEDKMSSSKAHTAIFLDDEEDVVKEKVMKHAFSGGQPTLKLHRERGGNPDIDVPFQWLYMMFEKDDDKIKELEEGYRKGEITTGEMKQHLIDKLLSFLSQHRKNREKVKVDKYMYSGKLAKEMWDKVYY